jgi:multidrug efflux pump subunit AcrA (membrane-fusion protein)
VEPLTPHPAKAKRQVSPDGEVLFVDVEVNPETQTVNFIILVDNSSEVLLAGTFAKVSLIPDEDTQPPETASR